jgi:hypothetical protein
MSEFFLDVIEQLAALAALGAFMWCVAVYGAVIFSVMS